MYNITLNILITQYKWDFIQENTAVFRFQLVGLSYWNSFKPPKLNDNMQVARHH